MLKYLCLLTVILFSCSSVRTYPPLERWTTPNSSSPADHRSQMQDLKRKTVRINFYCGPDIAGNIGSGVVVKKSNRRTVVATAKHVSDWMKENHCDTIVTDWRGRSGFAKIMEEDYDTDVSILMVDEPIGEAAELFNNPYSGQRIMCVGFPMLPLYKDVDEISYSEGIVMTEKVEGFIRVSADVYKGNSGGSCFSDNGKVVGIVSHFGIGGYNILGDVIPFPGQYYISDVKNVKNLLDMG